MHVKRDEIYSNLIPLNSKDVYHVMTFKIGQNTAGFVKQVNFINAEPCRSDSRLLSEMSSGLMEDHPNCFLINSHNLCNMSKCTTKRLLSDVGDQALCHEMLTVHVSQWFIEGSSARKTGKIEKWLLFTLVTKQKRAFDSGGSETER